MRPPWRVRKEKFARHSIDARPPPKVERMDLLGRLGLEHPVVQAGMGGGLSGARLAGAVSRAGGLGTIGILVDPQRLHAELVRARAQAPGRPLAANLLVPFARRVHAEACAAAGVEVVVLFCGS